MHIRSVLLFVAFFFSFSASAESTITINLSGKYLMTGDTRVIEIFDLNCNRNLGQFSLSANQIIPIAICQSSAGYGKIKRRNVTNNDHWIESALLSNGDEVTP